MRKTNKQTNIGCEDLMANFMPGGGTRKIDLNGNGRCGQSTEASHCTALLHYGECARGGAALWTDGVGEEKPTLPALFRDRIRHQSTAGRTRSNIWYGYIIRGMMQLIRFWLVTWRAGSTN